MIVSVGMIPTRHICRLLRLLAAVRLPPRLSRRAFFQALWRTALHAAWLACAGWATEAIAGGLAMRLPAGEVPRPGHPEERVQGLMSTQSARDSHRLPSTVLPTRYDLRLEPDLAQATFTGEVRIAVTVREPTAEILLNAAELQIREATIQQAQSGRQPDGPMRAAIELEAATERARLQFPASLTPGAWELRLVFSGHLNDKLRGFYRSTYKDAGGTSRTLAATQFEATDARRAFPCWDEPAFKAVFAVTLVIDPALTAVSNTAPVSEEVKDGKKVIRFADTIKMSTYLVAFVVGNLEPTDPVMVGRTPLRVWAVPGKRHLAAFGQEAAAFSLRFFEQYYDRPYPGDKLDLLAIPDFASGAMENLGAITFREDALLVDEKEATHNELERVADVVAHENAHMWFGDLVTMSWWNGLWLNEAFATFMEMLAVDAWKPDWQRWTTFGVSRAAALAVDGLHSSRPVEYAVRAPRDAEAMFDVLTYEKGASVLRMLEQHVGPEAFRDGVRHYLRAHAYGNADTGDLWTALGQASREAVPALMAGWIFHPGYPLITVKKRGGRLVLRQERFTYLKKPPAPQPSASRRSWQIPVQIRIIAKGKPATHRLLLTGSKEEIAVPKTFDAVVVNEGGHGFYRIRYEPALLERLLRLVPDGLPAIERFNLLNDAWATTVAGVTRLPDYLDLTAKFQADPDRNVWSVLLDSFQTLHRLVDPGDRPKVEALVRDRLSQVVAKLGWVPRPGESELTRQLRGEVLRAVGTIGNDQAVQGRAATLYTEARQGSSGRAGARATDSRDPNVYSAVIGILAHVGDRARYAEFLERFRAAATPQEERRYLYALAGFREEALVQETLARTINGEIRTQDGPFIVAALLLSVHGREQAWNFVKANWETLERLFPKQGVRRMLHGLAGLATPKLERDVRQFVAARKIQLGGKTLEQYLEQLRIAVAFRERIRPALGAYWKKTAAAHGKSRRSPK
jgi:puromycin-sensitive aminopeptidase